MTFSHDFLRLLATENAVLVTVSGHRGSVPREEGAWMAVFATTCIGSIGGGHLEWLATQQALLCLRGAAAATELRYALGPSLGQCCGGAVSLSFELVTARDLARLQDRFASQRSAWPCITLFGAGHVGQALVQLLGSLPVRLHWIDSREQIFPHSLPVNVTVEHCQPVQAAVADLVPGSRVLVMSFSHAEDQELVAACLLRQRLRADLAFIGLIGSKSKWSSFSHRLAARGFSPAELAQVTCPLGLPGIVGKEPAVIALAIAAQQLQLAGGMGTLGEKTVRAP